MAVQKIAYIRGVPRVLVVRPEPRGVGEAGSPPAPRLQRPLLSKPDLYDTGVIAFCGSALLSSCLVLGGVAASSVSDDKSTAISLLAAGLVGLTMSALSGVLVVGGPRTPEKNR